MNMASKGNRGLHVATVAHASRIWDAYLDLDDDPHRPEVYRGRIRFEIAGEEGFHEAPRTTVIIIEESYEAAVAKARAFDDRALQGLLRSCLPGGEGG